jgi:hypothetical protein
MLRENIYSDGYSKMEEGEMANKEQDPISVKENEFDLHVFKVQVPEVWVIL